MLEKATLGDLESLSALKEQLEEGEKKKKAAATKKVTKEAQAE
jgi:small subunit ribosomal protein S1